MDFINKNIIICILLINLITLIKMYDDIRELKRYHNIVFDASLINQLVVEFEMNEFVLFVY